MGCGRDSPLPQRAVVERMRRFNRLPLRQILGFTALPLLAAIAPLFVLPVIGRTVGAPGWAAIAIGQSVGTATSILVAFGWPAIGPSLVAAAEANQRAQYFRDSVHMRLLISVPAVLTTVMLASLLAAPGFRLAAALMGVAICMGGLSSSWYYVGMGQPARIALFDAGPRIAASLIAVPVLLVTRAVETYPLILIAFTVCGVLFATRDILRGASTRQPLWRDTKAHFRDQALIATSGVITSGYTGFSVAIVAIASGSVSAVAAFASAFRLQAMVKVSSGALANAFQGWVGEVRFANPSSRMLVALGSTTLLGIVGAIGIWYLLPTAVQVVFGFDISISTSISASAAVAFLLYSITLSLSLHILIPLGRVRVVALATIAAAVVGIPAIAVLSAGQGAEGAMLGIAIAETIVAGIELPVAIGALRRSSLRSASSNALTNR